VFQPTQVALRQRADELLLMVRRQIRLSCRACDESWRILEAWRDGHEERNGHANDEIRMTNHESNSKAK
jgi:hypothetical protein